MMLISQLAVSVHILANNNFLFSIIVELSNEHRVHHHLWTWSIIY